MKYQLDQEAAFILNPHCPRLSRLLLLQVMIHFRPSTPTSFLGGCQAPAAGPMRITLAVWPEFLERCTQFSYQLVQFGSALSIINLNGAEHTLATPLEHRALKMMSSLLWHAASSGGGDWMLGFSDRYNIILGDVRGLKLQGYPNERSFYIRAFLWNSSTLYHVHLFLLTWGSR